MEKRRKIVLLIIGLLVVLGLLFTYVAVPYLKSNTKKHSPEVTTNYVKNDLELEVFYNSPSKKGRTIFGELVPYDQIWRTGANEATTFSTTKDVVINGKTLPAGKYSLWTIPKQDSWEVIFNSKMYGWGVGFGGKPAHESEYDVIKGIATVSQNSSSEENFKIQLVEGSDDTVQLVLTWDTTQATLPIQIN